ncbi:4-hydroxy-tetrahydrodipicolinate reductase [Pullulanibacillus sp. KACC 23026]|uniref:4-hydroxy-tetrahydrodipicolinate reductase n=1 Tax=Pullulanibacillus sp. KACC 23026 TaxID=3028315 RepID=UPI0023AFD065|nr:4-hydroxy-tetrahydrodipicolinate reductase [Pullulanibacillus sp. KACC 23026]WEG11342.1 4-hydroxy-tetrahydrodipicolinate reductase [Pullulanibacillus sp. KACC 23026]
MAEQTIRIVVAGPRGKMGSETIHMIHRTPHFELVGAVDTKNEGLEIRDLEGLPDISAPIYTDLEACFSNTTPDVLIDFTHPEAGKQHIQTALAYKVRPVVGTSGFTEEEVQQFKVKADASQVGGIIAPNFAVGAVLMMKWSQMAARFFPNVEIIEQHHDQKRDAPSGTAIKTAEMIQKDRSTVRQGHPDEVETIPGARGANVDGFRIHSVRLPGLIAHQQVLFGGEGELLTIRHDSMNRLSFMNGVQLAVEEVMKLETLVYGLDTIMF